MSTLNLLGSEDGEALLERLSALEAKCALYAASLKKADALNAELVEALKSALRAVDESNGLHSIGEAATEQARAALAKARGEP